MNSGRKEPADGIWGIKNLKRMEPCKYGKYPDNAENAGSRKAYDSRKDRVTHSSHNAACNVHRTAKEIQGTDIGNPQKAVRYNIWIVGIKG